jgi:hypothetical protein
LLEGILTVLVAIVGYFWLPHSAETAWFLAPKEREYAATRVTRDRDIQSKPSPAKTADNEDEAEYDEESRGLLNPSNPATSVHRHHMVDDRGLSPHDLISSVCNTKIWHLLACNILSAVPVYAFSVFMPLVLAPLMKESNSAMVNLMTAPPHFCGVITLYLFARYSDNHRIRLIPILYGLIIVVGGLTLVVILPVSWPIPRYLALNILLSGTYVASPLTVAWISGNTPSPGKRALLLGINGWGNLAGILSAMLFKPKYAESGYIMPFWWTLACVTLSAVGYLLFLRRLQSENAARKHILREWSEDEIDREKTEGKGPLGQERPWLRSIVRLMKSSSKLTRLAESLEEAAQAGREGDERVTFVYGL